MLLDRFFYQDWLLKILGFLNSWNSKESACSVETWIRSLGQEDPLQKDMATHSSILAWRIPLTEEPGRLQSMESQRVGHDGESKIFTLIKNSTWVIFQIDKLKYIHQQNKFYICSQLVYKCLILKAVVNLYSVIPNLLVKLFLFRVSFYSYRASQTVLEWKM